MDEFTLEIADRTATGRHARLLRDQGVIPGVVYGAGQPPKSIQVEERELSRLLGRGGASHLVELVGEGFPKTRVLIREVQRHPVRRNLVHVDFVRIAAGAKIQIAVPLVIVGKAPAADEGAVLLQNADTIEIECMPDDLPAQIEVDISGLKSVSDRIAPADLVLPAGVVLVDTTSEEALISLTMPRMAVEEEVEAEEALAAEVGVEEEEAEAGEEEAEE